MGRQIVRLHFRTYPEDHLWVAECIELDVASGGQTEEEAQRRVEDATRLYLSIVAEKGIPVTGADELPIGHVEERAVPLPLGTQ